MLHTRAPSVSSGVWPTSPRSAATSSARSRARASRRAPGRLERTPMGPYHRLRYLVSTRGPTLTFQLHRFMYRASGGRLFSTSGGKMPVLLLTTTGRKSGQQRTWPLNYLRNVDDLVLVASNRGRDYYPAW